MTPRPPAPLLPHLERLLETRPPGVRDAIRRVASNVRPCVKLVSRRTTGEPLRVASVGRLLGRKPAAPILPPTASKFGGTPYYEHDGPPADGRFLGQINFSDVMQALRRQQFPVPAGLPERGLLAVDLTADEPVARVRWYPNPQPREPDGTPLRDQVAKYETAIDFEGSWSLRGLDWFDAAEGDEELWTYMNDLEIEGIDVDARGGHKLFGHANEALNEHYGFTPVAGRSDSIREYELLWRIDYDNEAGFSWGTNWLYVIIHRDDLARGALENAIVTGANA